MYLAQPLGVGLQVRGTLPGSLFEDKVLLSHAALAGSGARDSPRLPKYWVRSKYLCLVYVACLCAEIKLVSLTCCAHGMYHWTPHPAASGDILKFQFLRVSTAQVA